MTILLKNLEEPVGRDGVKSLGENEGRSKGQTPNMEREAGQNKKKRGTGVNRDKTRGI